MSADPLSIPPPNDSANCPVIPQTLVVPSSGKLKLSCHKQMLDVLSPTKLKLFCPPPNCSCPVIPQTLVRPPRDWTEWCDRDNPSGNWDYESLKDAIKDCKGICSNPYEADCRVVGTEEPFRGTGDIFREACTADGGLTCKNEDQGGRRCLDYEVRFLCPPDIDECMEGLATCHPNATCENTHGGYNCICNDGFIGDGQNCVEGARCTFWGDPHYTDLDGNKYDFQGICKYRLVEPCTDFGSMPDFRVVSKNRPISRPNLSVTKYVDIKVYGFHIVISGRNAQVDGSAITPPRTYQPAHADWPNSYLKIQMNTLGMEVITDFGLIVKNNGGSRYEIMVPKPLAGKTCGLCGDYNGLDDGYILPNGTRIDDPVLAADAWRSDDSDPRCANVTLPPLECSGADIEAATLACSAMKDTNKFGQCNAVIEEKNNEYFDACVYDVCRDRTLLCANLESLENECEEKGVKVVWRTATLCPPNCPENMHYEESGPTCPETCSDPSGSCSERLTEVAGCQCNAGYVLSGTVCVKREECGCLKNNKYYKDGESYLDTGCTAICTCINGNIECSPTVQCHEHGECYTTADGSSDCRCKEGFSGDGKNCLDEDECSLSKHSCSPNARCINSKGAYTCTCLAGFTGDGFNCEDADECSDETDRCSPDAECRNEFGSYACICRDGYKTDDSGKVCLEIIPEEPDIPKDCGPFQKEECMECAKCKPLSTPFFTCVCPPGTVGDGRKGPMHSGCSMPQCSEGWIKHDDGCYIVNDKPEPFDVANKECQAQGGHLASILDHATVAFLKEQMELLGHDGKYWIGYTDKSMEGIYVWADNSVSDYSNWAEGEPATEDKQSRDCVAMGEATSFKFVTQKCNIEQGFVCRKPLQLHNCPKGWYSFNGACYMSTDEKLPWTEAYLQCVAHGADLSAITSSIEGEIIREYVIPARDGADLWIGAFSNGNDEFLWADGTDFGAFTHWGVGQPNNTGGERCVMSDSMMRWADVNCDLSLGFICEKKMTNQKSCPEGTLRYQTDCITIKKEPEPFDPKNCLDSGSKLVRPVSGIQQDLIRKYLQRQSELRNPWIDVRESGTEGDYSPATYFSWGNGQPDDNSDPNNCVYMMSGENYNWNDEDCSVDHPTLCAFTLAPCRESADCVGADMNSKCYMGQCRCKNGFRRNNDLVCEDIDECSEGNPCDDQVCENQDGRYQCTCREGFAKYGDRCMSVTACNNNDDCNTRAICVGGECQCKEGYMGDGKDHCDNVNECEEETHDCSDRAYCEDKDGSYDCPCKPGYVKDLLDNCMSPPRDCDDVRELDPNARSGSYQIDPDGEGGCDPFTVSCIMRDGIGITVVASDSQTPRPIRSTDTSPEAVKRAVEYTKTAAQMKCIIDASKFCYQNMLYQCTAGAQLAGVSSYTTGSGNKVPIDSCSCGMFRACANPDSQCNCDGTPMGEQVDEGKIIDKDQLPITYVNVPGVSPGQQAALSVGPLMCSQKQFDIPKDCDDAMKNYGLKKNEVILIDVDGPTGDAAGNLEPFMVYCDVESYPDIGVTVIPPKDPVTTPTTPGEIPVKYPASPEAVKKLIDTSDFCSQNMSYLCKNSKLMGGGDLDGFWTSLDGTKQEYWAGGLGGQYMCGCGVTRSCEQDTVQCNCDIEDGQERKDFGTIIDKSQLPVGSVTLNDIGGDSSGTVTVGALRCGQKQFGILQTCQHIREMGYTDDYTYLIDPDGADDNTGSNVKPFPVVCDMVEDRPVGITIVGHDRENPTNVDNSEEPGSYEQDITYIDATPEQLEALTEVSSYCSQEMAISCLQATLNNLADPSLPYAYWIDNNGNKRQYFSGSEGSMCQCGASGDCLNNMQCNCDANSDDLVMDNGILTNKKDLPVRTVLFGDTGDNDQDMIQYKVGKLVCHGLFKTCSHIYKAYQSVAGQSEPENGEYVIDPDGIMGEDPFLVDCLFPSITIVNLERANYHKLPDTPENRGPEAVSVKPVYIDANTPQLEALTLVSGFCRQFVSYTCQYSPLSTHGYWTSSDGSRQKGWGGNAGGYMCACGEVNKCAGGFTCNCDANDGEMRKDDGWLIDKSLLPVTTISFGLSEGDIPAGDERMAEYYLGALECSDEQFGIYKDCQDLRNSLTPYNEVENNAELIDPDGLGDLEPFTAYCEMTRELPIGITVIPPDVPNPVDIPPTATVVKIPYTSGSDPQLEELTVVSQYCTQEMKYVCSNGAVLTLAGDQGLYSRDGNNLAYWAGNTDGMGCANGQCNCDGSSDTSDGGDVLDKSVLPLSSANFGVSSGARVLTVGDLRCFGLFKSCHDIKMAGVDVDPNWNGMYAIDSDGAGPLEPFLVQCDFLSEPGIGITIVNIEGPVEFPVTDQPLNEEIPYDNGVTPEQAHQLAQVSGFCLQGMKYKCKNAALMGAGGAFLGFDGTVSTKFSGADNGNVDGCACVLLDTCKHSEVCRCDAEEPMGAEEGDFVTNRDILPVTGVKSDGVSGDGAEASFTVGSLRCGPREFGIPKDCQEALEFGYKTGEALIQPSEKVKPFMVFCDMDSYPGKGVTVIKTNVVDTPVNGATDVPVVYTGATPEQIDALVKESDKCYLPMKFTCRATKFSDAFSIKTNNTDDITFFGSARQNRMCSCGEQNRCGGDDGRAAMEVRKCNCDVGDDKDRVDAGVFGNQGDMPITSISFDAQPSGGSGSLTLGSLYCVDKPIDLDECHIGFNDCHENAECINRNGYYQCACQEGYRGKGRQGLWANGRECYDDDDCAMGMCPDNSLCTNTEGSYTCTCLEGYQMNANNECEDVNECAQGSHNCHSLAECTNTEPGFSCQCAGASIGDGVTCMVIGTCSMNDDKYTTFDGAFLPVVKPCLYRLARYSCGLLPNSISVEAQYAEFAGESQVYLAELIIKGFDMTVKLGMDGLVNVDGRNVNLPFIHNSFSIQRQGDYAIVTSPLLPYWFARFDGQGSADVGYPDNGINFHCGMCGNFNGDITDDYTGGDSCPAAESMDLTVVEAGHALSWLMNPGSPGCDCDPISPPLCTDDIANQQANDACNKLYDEISGPFATCVSAMKNKLDMASLLFTFLGKCVDDVCLATEKKAEICSQARQLVVNCQDMLGDEFDSSSLDDLFNFITTEGCEHICDDSANMEYRACGPACPSACGNPSECVAEVGVCNDGCYCKEGYILDDYNKCVRPKDCGCILTGSPIRAEYIPIGETVVNIGCTKECTCTSTGNLECEPLTCGDNSVCEVRQGVEDCYCDDGYQRIGDKCYDIDECSMDMCGVNTVCENKNGTYSCSCKPGYTEDMSGECVDVNECLDSTDQCDADTSECDNTDGGYSCKCKNGFAMNPETKQCEDVDECTSNRQDCDLTTTVCRNTDGSFECDCKSGYERVDDKQCQDINECNTDAHDCVPNSECMNTVGSFKCECKAGFKMVDGDCKDIDECTVLTQPCIPKSTCENTVGSYRCDCISGHSKDITGTKCEDIDECKHPFLSPDCQAPNSRCINNEGSYTCACKPGFSGDGTTCTDDDECLNSLICGSHSQCNNNPGSYSCECLEGYSSITANNLNCKNIDECATEKDDCDDKATCTDTVGSYTCLCEVGFTGDGKTCGDINECDVPDICGDHASCTNNDGSYVCLCNSGYSMEDSRCKNIDECAHDDANDCDINAHCEDDTGSYMCTCHQGYTGDGMEGNCTSIDECDDPTLNDCSPDREVCVEKDSGYDCECRDGFMPDGDDCVDIPECSNGQHNCHPVATCTETPGSFKCDCPTGYTGDGTSCEDINECDTTCNGDGQICSNSPGSYSCTCKQGYEQEADMSCSDINECSETPDVCSPNSDCENTIGNYECKCKEGFTGSGSDGTSVSCADFDECTQPGGSPCGTDQLCNNTAGGYTCFCEEGYVVNGMACDDINECENDPCGLNEDCTNIDGSYDCDCKDGFTMEGDPGQCVDINECSDGSAVCSSNGICENTVPSYTCDTCKTGYSGNGKVCDDIDECLSNPCDEQTSTCVDTEGSYKCECKDGYMPDGDDCVDVNECDDTDICDDKSECKNTIGSYRCDCKEGYMLDGTVCVDVDDCEPNPCIGGECVDGLNSFTCECQGDDVLHSDGINCLAPDDCTFDSSVCSSEAHLVCKNEGARSKCRCDEGYEMDLLGCQDIDECVDGLVNCNSNEMCENSEGAYDCVCMEGYSRSAISGECEDNDECTPDDPCPDLSSCNNTPGLYDCICDDGYEMVLDMEGNFDYCKDIDECATDVYTCPSNSECQNEDGTYRCQCKVGFGGANCEDIDECAEESPCSPQATCTDTEGSFTCTCVAGYNGNGITCTDIDECEDRSHNCAPNSDCVNFDGGYECVCQKGYNGHCDACEDINECATGLSSCDSHAQCVNIPGSYTCQCYEGYSLKDGRCEENNECQLGTAIDCGDFAVCVNTRGSYMCQCYAGYEKGANNLCENINECTRGSHECSPNAKCIDSEGGYDCECNNGYAGNGLECIVMSPQACGNLTCHETAICVKDDSCECPEGTVSVGVPLEGSSGCNDENECETANDCDPNAECTNTDRSYTCTCQQGYSGDGKSCTYDTPVGCAVNTDCGFNSECKPNGSCQCYRGYEGENGFNCRDMNECESAEASNLCGDNTRCVNDPGSYRCTCLLGFTDLDTSKSPATCKDIDECITGRHHCAQTLGLCSNTIGGYECSCEEGASWNGISCTVPDSKNCSVACNAGEVCNADNTCTCQPDFERVGDLCLAINRCPELCHPKAFCSYVPEFGSTCTCNDGYEGNGRYCLDVNECATGQLECKTNENCINEEGNAYCSCVAGYHEEDGECVIDGSVSDPCACGVDKGTCIDMDNRICSCDNGYVFKPSAVKDRCRDLNECNAGGYCHIKASCSNFIGGYSCECLPGFVGDGENLCEKDGCDPNPCGPNALRCVNAVGGSHICECPDGYSLVVNDCVKDDADCTNNGGCGANAVCTVDEFNEATCQCKNGFRGDGTSCVDVDECIEGREVHHCDQHAVCSNSEGSYSCTCNVGYRGDGYTCEEVDECAEKIDDCSPYANCINVIESFRCECKTGYNGDGKSCTLDLGCQANNNCDPNAQCLLTEEEGYICKCNNGYTGDGLTCQKLNECEDPNLNNCNPSYYVRCEELDIGFKCVCLPGFEPVPGSVTVCQDKDECAGSMLTNCGNNSECQNEPGSYRCVCKKGYTGTDGRDCIDVDECSQSDLNQCSYNADCENKDGFYKCTCKSGYEGDGISCLDVNECLSGIADCKANSVCQNLIGGFACNCLPGFEKNEIGVCVDVNECGPIDALTTPCDTNAKCTNTIGTFSCQCLEGYRGNGFKCDEINPCDEAGVCHANATCSVEDRLAVCTCKPGYKGDGINECNNTNECETGEDNCHELANCINLDEGFECECKKGYHGDGVNNCDDIDECDPSSPNGGGHECDGDGSECENSVGGYSCPCIKGYKQETERTCIRIDLCDTDFNDCHDDATCEDISRNVVCTCKEGFEGDGRNCNDINECLDAYDCPENSTCLNTKGSYTCVCATGYRLVGDTCDDIDECTEDAANCDSIATCKNNRGSYTCVCAPGYTLNKDTNKCEDVNECDLYPCHEFASCSNTIGSYGCECDSQSIGDGVVCKRITKCVDPNPGVTCGSNAVCSDTATGAVCVCSPGYEGDPLTGCTNINECPTGVCDERSDCTDEPGSYSCACKQGYRGNSPSCEDIDECTEGGDLCGNNEKCENTVGSFKCVCRDGYGGSPCAPINECLSSPCNSLSEVCVDKDNGYTCNCANGYVKNSAGTGCVDINECNGANNPCDTSRATCVNTPGSVTCRCKTGFRDVNNDGLVCTDIDECSQNKCDLRATCTNSPGSYTCVCKEGFTGNGRTCEDINECSPTNPCVENASCENAPGSYTCSCNRGYVMVGGVCQDENECQSSNMCGQNTFCRNVPGSYECPCIEKYEKDALQRCVPINPCRDNPCPPAPRGVCTPDGLVAKCSCESGYSGTNCDDIDECSVGGDRCPGGTCKNVPGHYYCECPAGTVWESGACVDINECKLPASSANAAHCGDNEYCSNNIGSFTCLCKVGFYLKDGSCEDINECDTSVCDPNADCFNLVGSYRCDCHEGFTGTGRTCIDIDECTLYPAICGEVDVSICSNTQSNYSCSCINGYELNANKRCQDVNECDRYPGLCGLRGGQCGNTKGNYICRCPEGYYFDNGDCKDINECVTENLANCDANADCLNTDGSFECECQEGYIGDGRTCRLICGPGACPQQSTCSVVRGQPKCECKCNGPRCLVPGMVCGSDGISYSSESQLIIIACELEKQITKQYDGPCKASCEFVPCAKREVCVIDGVTGNPTCKCPECTEAEVNSDQLCTNKNRLFDNLCAFKKYQCRHPQDDSVLAQYGACPGDTGCQVTDFGPWSECSVSCGDGKMTKERTVIFSDNSDCPTLVQTAKCYQPPCANSTCQACPRVGQVCASQNDQEMCMCPECAGRDTDYVCAKLGDSAPSTFINRCQLQRAACVLGKIFTEVHPAKCGVENPSQPLNCSVISRSGRVRIVATGCSTTHPKLVNKCSGGCGDKPGNCCRPKKVRFIHQEVKCLDNSLKVIPVPLISECECAEDEGLVAEEASTTYEGYKFLYNE